MAVLNVYRQQYTDSFGDEHEITMLERMGATPDELAVACAEQELRRGSARRHSPARVGGYLLRAR